MVASDWDGRDVVILGLLSFIRFGYSISSFFFLGLCLLSSHARLLSIEAQSSTYLFPWFSFASSSLD